MRGIIKNKRGMNLPRLLLGTLASIIIILGIYTLMVIVGPNYDYKYEEMLSSGEIINPAMEYVGNVGEGVWNFLSEEITSSKFLDLSMILPANEEPEQTGSDSGVEITFEIRNDTQDENTSIEEEGDVEDIGDSEEDAIEEELEEIVVKDEDKKDLIKYILVLMKAYNLHNPPFSSNTPKMEFDMEGEKFNAEIIQGEIYIDEGRIDGEDVRVHSNWGEAVVMSKGLDYIKTSFGSGRSTIEQVADDKTCFLKGYKEVYEELSTE